MGIELCFSFENGGVSCEDREESRRGWVYKEKGKGVRGRGEEGVTFLLTGFFSLVGFFFFLDFALVKSQSFKRVLGPTSHLFCVLLAPT